MVECGKIIVELGHCLIGLTLHPNLTLMQAMLFFKLASLVNTPYQIKSFFLSHAQDTEGVNGTVNWLLA